MQRLARQLPLSVLLLFIALGVGACIDNDGSVELATAEQPTLYNDYDTRTPIWNYIGDSTYHSGLMHGMAVADLDMNGVNPGTPKCTGWLVSDDILVTARHCRTPDWSGGATIRATFGDFTLGTATGRDRLRERVGLTQSQANAAAVGSFTVFTCTYVSSSYTSSEGYRDIIYYQCQPNPISGVQVLPGHIWGKVPVDDNERNDHTPIYSISSNHNKFAHDSGSHTSQVLLAPLGEIETRDAATTSYAGNPTYYNNSDTLGNDHNVGSSGGPVLDRATHRAFALISGQRCGSCADWGLFPNSPDWENIIANISNKIRVEYVDSAPTIETGFPSVIISASSWVGGTGGTLRTDSCPANHVVGGIVATQGFDDDVGLLGIVCVPWANSIPRQLDDAVVMARGGSHDISFHSTAIAGDDYATYINEVQSYNGGTFYEATTVMCPPGSWLYAIRGTVSTFIDSISWIECRSPQNWSTSRQPRIGIGVSSGTSFYTGCGGTSSYATGLRRRAGWVTDGFQLNCNNL